MYLLSHLRGKAHQEAVKDREDSQEEVIIVAPPDKRDAKLAQDRERLKALRKRCKKIRSRMALRLGREFTSDILNFILLILKFFSCLLQIISLFRYRL